MNNTFKNIDKYNENSKKKNTDINNSDYVETKETVIKSPQNTQADYRETNPSWKKGNGEWYYYDNKNKIVTGWVKTEKGWYYFYTDGVMQKNCLVVEDGQEYYLGDDGLLTIPDNNLEENSEGYYDDEKQQKINSNKSENKDSEDNNDKETEEPEENENDDETEFENSEDNEVISEKEEN